MSINSAGRRLVADFEGFRSEAYLCPAGVWTIGYGFTDGVQPGDVMTRAEADARLLRELQHYADGVLRLLTRAANENELAAMTSLAFNIGLAGFGRSTVLRCHNRGDSIGAAAAFGLWNKAGGRVLHGLVRRRSAEAELYLRPVIGIAPVQRVDAIVPRVEPEDEPTGMPQKIDAERPLTQSHIMRGAGVSGGVAGVTLAAEGARAVSDIRMSLGDWLPYIALGVIVVVAGWIIYERLKQRRNGIA